MDTPPSGNSLSSGAQYIAFCSLFRDLFRPAGSIHHSHLWQFLCSGTARGTLDNKTLIIISRVGIIFQVRMEMSERSPLSSSLCKCVTLPSYRALSGGRRRVWRRGRRPARRPRRRRPRMRRTRPRGRTPGASVPSWRGRTGLNREEEYLRPLDLGRSGKRIFFGFNANESLH